MSVYTITVRRGGESRKLVLGRGECESERHLTLKVLAYMLFFDRQPLVEIKVGQHFKPDLVAWDGRDVQLWVDCGKIAIDKLDRVRIRNPDAEIAVVKPTRREAWHYRQEARRVLRRPAGVTIYGFDRDFAAGLVARMTTRWEVAFELAGDLLRVEAGGAWAESSVHALPADQPDQPDQGDRPEEDADG